MIRAMLPLWSRLIFAALILAAAVVMFRSHSDIAALAFALVACLPLAFQTWQRRASR
jgi:hypothetical protein